MPKKFKTVAALWVTSTKQYRDKLLFHQSTPTTPTDWTHFKLKPKFLFPGFGEPQLPKYYSVRVVCAVTPISIYAGFYAGFW